jgi:hypothetical protein
VKNARQGFLEHADRYTVLEHLPRSLKALFVVAFHSGCRQRELLKMRWHRRSIEMVQHAGIPEAQAMLMSGQETRSMLERYNIVSLKNLQDAGAKLDAWSRQQKNAVKVPVSKTEANPKQTPSQKAGEHGSDAPEGNKEAGGERRKEV